MTDRGTEIERVARALCAANFAKKGAEGEFGNVDDCWWAFTDEAKAAISAMSSEDEVRRLRAELDHLCASIEAENERGIGVSGTLMSDMREARTALTPNPCGQGS